MKTYKSHPIILGTFILTITGLISRIIGFYYRIYLTRLFGEEGMGIYQLLGPVLALSFSFTAAGYQTAISKSVAEQSGQNSHNPMSSLLAGLSISLPLSLVCNAFLFFHAGFIGRYLLLEPRTIPMIRILSFSIPFGAIHSCINGYFYGKKKTAVPAITQLAEQIARVGCVFFVSARSLSAGKHPSIQVAVLGLTFGELISMAISVGVVLFTRDIACSVALQRQNHKIRFRLSPLYRSLLATALPLTANRVVLNLLQSVESISIPAALKSYGYDTATALSVYGVLTGMAMPLIFFPNALTGSVAVLLLPFISENYARKDMYAVHSAIDRTLKYCGLLGFFSLCGFVFFGKILGQLLFHSTLAGHFITTLGFICPFLYLDTTLSSILQGLGKAGSVFLMNVISLTLRLLFIFFMIPRFGISGYLWGLLASQLLQTVLYLGSLFLLKQGKLKPK